jgi:RNase P subunit RPR2
MGSPSKKRSAKGMHVCRSCDSILVQPVNWHERSDGHWHVELRCPACEWWGRGRYSQAEMDAYDEELDRGVQRLLDDLRSLTLANMTEEAERSAAGPPYSRRLT